VSQRAARISSVALEVQCELLQADCRTVQGAPPRAAGGPAGNSCRAAGYLTPLGSLGRYHHCAKRVTKPPVQEEYRKPRPWLNVGRTQRDHPDRGAEGGACDCRDERRHDVGNSSKCELELRQLSEAPDRRGRFERLAGGDDECGWIGAFLANAGTAAPVWTSDGRWAASAVDGRLLFRILSKCFREE
jgi:hypothetical protein